MQPGLCRTWSETPKTGFLRTRLNYCIGQMVKKLSQWQPVDLVDKEATKPLRSQSCNSRVASGKELSQWQPVDLVNKEATKPLRSQSYNSRVASGKLSQWQPVDLVDKEATKPLRSQSYNSRVASGKELSKW